MGQDDRPDIRASDGEREQTAARLRDAAVEGRLALEDFGERVEAAHRAITRAGLEQLVGDLPAPAAPATAPANARQTAVFSRLARRGQWQLPLRSSVRCIFGTVDLDLREATVSGALVQMDVYNLFGTVTVIVPAGVAVDVEGGGVLASQEIDVPEGPAASAAPRLVIRASGPGGTLRVRTGPRRDRTVVERVGLGTSSAR